MKTCAQPSQDEKASNRGASTPGDLLEMIKLMRGMAGDALDDDEFTFFLQGKGLPSEEGFAFLCFHDGCATLKVPFQSDSDWHPSQGWITPAKESIAKSLARKRRLFLSEPPDSSRRFLMPPEWTQHHHHLDFYNNKESVIIAHPEFLKVRLFASDTKLAYPPAAGLIQDLALLYQKQESQDEKRDQPLRS